MSFSEDCSQILYMEANINYTWIIYITGRKELKSATLQKVHAALPPSQYRRIHRKYLVNQKYVIKINKDNVLLENGEILPIARRRRL